MSGWLDWMIRLILFANGNRTTVPQNIASSVRYHIFAASRRSPATPPLSKTFYFSNRAMGESASGKRSFGGARTRTRPLQRMCPGAMLGNLHREGETSAGKRQGWIQGRGRVHAQVSLVSSLALLIPTRSYCGTP